MYGFDPLTSELIQDSELDIAAITTSVMAMSIARVLEEDFTTADGNNKPTGLVKHLEGLAGNIDTIPKAKFTVAGADSALYDAMIDSQAEFDSAYMRNLRLMFHPKLMKYFRRVKDQNGNYMWNRGATGGAPPTIMDLPYFYNMNMESNPGSAANKSAVVMGNFTSFIVRQVRALVIRRLTELAGLSDQTILVGFMRVDSKVMQNQAFRLIRTAA